MDTSALKKFAQSARRDLVAQVSTRLDVVLALNSDERRDYPAAVSALEAAIQKADREQVIEKAAYTWFNRFCALTFMDRNNYNAVHIVTPGEDGIRPAILSEALGGHVDATVPDKDRARIRALLDRTAPSREPELEAYKILLASACQQWHKLMPFMFGRIEDWTELLMPGDLLAETSVLNEMRAVMSEEACQDVEIIGWLYQFYISEKKDEVFAALKKNVKITAANIPAATQLFTPHWIVRYLVENSLGRLWLLNKPSSNLAAQMEYYIAPEEPETDFLKVSKPEEIKICDPAVGSGHMLTYAFDLLYAIYEEEGYSPDDIPALILTHNLTGIEIDDRAGALAAFALTMKAASKLGRRKFLQHKTQPNICVLQNVSFTESEMQDVAAVLGKDLFTGTMKETLKQFEQAKNFGSLITPRLRDPSEALRKVEAEEFSDTFQIKDVKGRVAQVLRMAEALSPKYHVVVANPPYMGGKGMNGKLGAFAKQEFPESKSDLFAAFIERSFALSLKRGLLGFLTMQSWMFLGSYSDLRSRILDNNRLIQLFHTGPGLFPELGSFNVLTSAFIICVDVPLENNTCIFIKANEDPKIDAKIHSLKNSKAHISLDLSELDSVPDRPIVYWLSPTALRSFSERELIYDKCPPRQGMATSDNARFVRSWMEVSFETIGLHNPDAQSASSSLRKWFPYNKGGNYQKWYGNNNDVVNWENNGNAIKNFTDSNGKVRSAVRNEDFYFKEGIVYSLFGFENFGVRYKGKGFIFDVSGSSMFPEDLEVTLAYLCSNVAFYFLKALAPTVNFQVGDLARLPLPELTSHQRQRVQKIALDNIKIVKDDWDEKETSWDFRSSPLLNYGLNEISLAADRHLDFRQSQRDSLRANEEEINEILIENFSLNGSVEKTVSDRDLSYNTVTKSEIMVDFIHTAVGCMFGRYSLDAPGLILANQGETLQDYLAKVPSPTFEPDDDNVIPILDGDWFSDDITQRFRDFLRVTFGEVHFVENLEFIEEALGKDIRKYFLKDFYGDHVKRYKKRPIYWQFSSPRGYFNAVIYMHRYRSDTVSIVLNDYLRDFKAKLQAHIKSLEAITLDPSTSDREKTKAGKEIDNTRKALHDIESYESEILFPLAEQQVEIDLDDGVKQNYPKFGKALKKVTGLSAK